MTTKPLMAPYVSADIETTGLNPKTSLIIEIGAVIDIDGVTDRNSLPTFQALIKNDSIYGDDVALEMNKLLIERAQDLGMPIKDAVEAFVEFIKTTPGMKANDPRVTFCGKNFSMFDRDFLATVMDIKAHMKHRVMDAGNLFYPYFGKMPSLPEINEIVFGTPKVAHTAVEDSLNCIDVFRWEFEFRRAMMDFTFRGTPMPSKFHDFMRVLQEMGL